MIYALYTTEAHGDDEHLHPNALRVDSPSERDTSLGDIMRSFPVPGQWSFSFLNSKDRFVLAGSADDPVPLGPGGRIVFRAFQIDEGDARNSAFLSRGGSEKPAHRELKPSAKPRTSAGSLHGQRNHLHNGREEPEHERF